MEGKIYEEEILENDVSWYCCVHACRCVNGLWKQPEADHRSSRYGWIWNRNIRGDTDWGFR